MEPFAVFLRIWGEVLLREWVIIREPHETAAVRKLFDTLHVGDFVIGMGVLGQIVVIDPAKSCCGGQNGAARCPAFCGRA